MGYDIFLFIGYFWFTIHYVNFLPQRNFQTPCDQGITNIIISQTLSVWIITMKNIIEIEMMIDEGTEIIAGVEIVTIDEGTKTIVGIEGTETTVGEEILIMIDEGTEKTGREEIEMMIDEGIQLDTAVEVEVVIDEK